MSQIFKFRRILLILCLVTSNLAMAVLHDEMIFNGKAKNTGKPCTLKVFSLTETATPFTVQVEATIYDPNESTNEIFEFTVKKTNSTQGFNVFSGGMVGKDQLNIFAPQTSDRLTKPNKFSVKWLHGDHFHSEQCEGLTLNE